MDEAQLRNCLTNDFHISKFPHKVLARNEIAQVCSPGIHIVNTDLSSQPGSHWVLIILNKRCESFIFDSLALHADYASDILNSLHGKVHLVTTNILQAPLSQTCGGYCLYFARLMTSLGVSAVSIELALQPLSGSNLLANDLFIQEFLARIFFDNTRKMHGEVEFCCFIPGLRINFVWHNEIASSLHSSQ